MKAMSTRVESLTRNLSYRTKSRLRTIVGGCWIFAGTGVAIHTQVKKKYSFHAYCYTQETHFPQPKNMYHENRSIKWKYE